MELVIKIPEGIYRRISQKYRYLTLDDIGLKTFDKVCVAIKDGTPLPKGHGRLIDADAYINEYSVYGWLGDTEIDDFNEITPTIIEGSDNNDT